MKWSGMQVTTTIRKMGIFVTRYSVWTLLLSLVVILVLSSVIVLSGFCELYRKHI